MTRAAPAALLLTVVCSSTAGPTAQRRAPSVEAGTATIRGQVVAADSNAAVRDVTVFLRPTDVPPTGYVVSSTGALTATGFRPVRVDADGRFEFTQLGAGSYRLAALPGATAARYIASVYPDPASDDPRPIVVGRGQTVDGVVVPLVRGAAIVGRVVNEYGDPVTGATVTAVDSLNADRSSARNVQGALGIRSDDLGSFRVYGLREGEYVVLAQPPPPIFDVIAGGDGAPPVPQGEYGVSYFPAPPSPSGPVGFRLRPGEEYGPIELTLVRNRLFTIRGTVLDPDGRPVGGASVVLRRADGPNPANIAFASPGIPSAADGSFELTRVPAGEHAIQASRHSMNPDSGGPEQGYLAVSVHDNVEGVHVNLRRPVTIRGRVVFEGAPPAAIAGIRVGAVPVRSVPGGTGATTVQIQPDFAFAVDGQFSPVLIRPTAPRGWHLKAVLQAGRDITDQPTEFDSGGAIVQVVLTQQAAALTGVVTNRKDLPTEAAVVLFAEDPAFWHERFSTTRLTYSTVDGTYKAEGLRPGRYAAVALPRDDASLQKPASYFELLSRHATPVVIGEGESKTLNLKLTMLRQ